MSNIVINSHEEWLKFRQTGGIGASEAAAVIGKSPWCTNEELWRRKTGRATAPDISNNAAVAYGHDAEPLIRALFALDYADKYEVEYGGEFDVVVNPEHPFIFATLDGRLTEKDTGRKGVLEIKTTKIVQSMQKLQWWKDGKPSVPDQYYCQLLHQLLATGFDFAVLHAQLKYEYDGDIRTERIYRQIERSEVLEDMEFLRTEEIAFWKLVQDDTPPGLILPEY